ncbi:MAG TPA: TetR/AcrR family transcriptional regulator [Acidimicrobiales bacterium]|nr:TetR/AcrR family transcriptional regulator [Acidimicrobiales bacterium]
MKGDPERALDEPADEVDEPAWRRRAVSRSLTAARSRAEERVQRFLDAAFALIDESGTTDFTIQEVIDRSGQSLRAFYQHFSGKDELLLALFEETVRESGQDLRQAVESETDPFERLHAFTIRLHDWCDPEGRSRRRGSHNRRPIMEFTLQLVADHPEDVKAAMAPVTDMLLELLEEAVSVRAIKVADTRRAAVLVQQTVLSSWLGSLLAQSPRSRVTAEETWEFCLHGLQA